MVTAAPPKSNNLYQDVVKVTQDYLGPASEEFITRHIQTHLKKKPEDITGSDLVALSEWLKLAIALLTDDPKLVDSYKKSLLQLAKK